MKLAIISGLCLLSCAALAAPQGTLSVHILNQQTGRPSEGVAVELAKKTGDDWVRLHRLKRIRMEESARFIRRLRICSPAPTKSPFAPAITLSHSI